MAYLFGRICILEIQTEKETFEISGSIGNFKPSGQKASKSSYQKVEFNNFRIAFDFTRDLTNSPDQASIQIYNINTERWNNVDFEKDNAKIILKCGYEDIEPEIIFIGQITKYSKRRKR